MNFIEIIYIAIIITSLLWLVYYNKVKSNFEQLNKNIDTEVFRKSDVVIDELKDQILQLKNQILIEKTNGFNEGYEKAKSEISVEIFPYREEFFQGDDGFIINDIYHEVKIGYKYQLFISGLPVLEPAIIIENILIQEKRKVDYHKIEKAINLVENTIFSIASKAGGYLKLRTDNEKPQKK